MININDLNEIQKEACLTKSGPVLILAGAGSGKTRTIIYRMANLIDSGIAGKNILGITFTKKAANQMKDRLNKLIGENEVNIGTFHGIAYRILRENQTKTTLAPKFTIYDTSDQLSIITQGIANYSKNRKFDTKLILSKISRLKEQDIESLSFSESVYYNQDDQYDLAIDYIYNYYQEQLTFLNAIDFTDILRLVVRLFKQYPDLAIKYSKLFQFIMVDEYQDTNKIQWEFLKQLTTTHNNICVVGDDYQSIYGFRGSSVDNILNFTSDYPGTKVFKLLHNYRSGEGIIALANELINSHQGGIKKELIGVIQEKSTPSLWTLKDPEDEAKLVVHDIIKRGNLGKTAILLRSQSLSPPIEEELVSKNISYVFLGGKKFFNHKEIKDLTAYLSFINNYRDDVSLRRILNLPPRGIGLTTLEKYVEIAKFNNTSLYQSFKENPDISKAIPPFLDLIDLLKKTFRQNDLKTATRYLITTIKLIEHLDKEYAHNASLLLHKKKNIEYFLNSLRDDNLADFLGRIHLDEDLEKDQAPQESLTISTLHSAKGLEFDHVYIIGAEEGILPHKKCSSKSEIQEELRLAYVGVTRAKRSLVITNCKYRYRNANTKLSRFFTNLNNLKSTSNDDNYRKNFFKNILSELNFN